MRIATALNSRIGQNPVHLLGKAQNLSVQARAYRGYREKGAKSMFYRMSEPYATMTDVAAAWITLCVILGGLFLMTTYL